MHGHPVSVAVFLADAHFRLTYPGGKAEEITGNAGQVLYVMASPTGFDPILRHDYVLEIAAA